jgi:ATP-dependent helicase/nuclease subunit A
MSEQIRLRNEADANQARASDPSASAWVSANAGTGKTEVLVKRCLRLFLAGARPESILCLTYTKTAAAAMQNRLLKELAEWATMPADRLRDVLSALMGRPPDEEDLRTARRLFALALEARGGLKIYTIHGFCERVLQRFPLEAEVTPHFKVLDELAQAGLRRVAFDTVMARGAKDGGGTLGKALAKITAVTSEDYFREVVAKLLGKRSEFERMMAHHGGGDDWPEAEHLALKILLDVEEAEEEALILDLAGVMTDHDLDAALSAFESFGDPAKLDRQTEASLRTARATTGDRRAAALREIFMTDKGAPRKTVCSTAGDRAPNRASQVRRSRAEARSSARGRSEQRGYRARRRYPWRL